MNETTICTGTEDCPCSDCLQAREDFAKWVDAFDQRWAERKQARECGPLCRTHGDVRDHSAVR